MQFWSPRGGAGEGKGLDVLGGQGGPRAVLDLASGLDPQPGILQRVVAGVHERRELGPADAGVREPWRAGIVIGKPAVHGVVEGRGPEPELGGCVDESPVDRNVSHGAQVVTGGQGAEVAGIGDLRHHDLGHPLGHLQLLGRPGVEEDPGGHLDRPDPEPGVLAADVEQGWAVNVDPGDPGPPVGGWVAREEGVVEVGKKRRLRPSRRRVDPQVGTLDGPRVGLLSQEGKVVASPVGLIEQVVGPVPVDGPRGVPRDPLHVRRGGIAVMVVPADGPVDLGRRRDLVPGAGGVVEPVDDRPGPRLRHEQGLLGVQLVLGDLALGLGQHQVGDPQQGQDHHHQQGDQQCRAPLSRQAPAPTMENQDVASRGSRVFLHGLLPHASVFKTFRRALEGVGPERIHIAVPPSFSRLSKTTGCARVRRLRLILIKQQGRCQKASAPHAPPTGSFQGGSPPGQGVHGKPPCAALLREVTKSVTSRRPLAGKKRGGKKRWPLFCEERDSGKPTGSQTDCFAQGLIESHPDAPPGRSHGFPTCRFPSLSARPAGDPGREEASNRPSGRRRTRCRETRRVPRPPR